MNYLEKYNYSADLTQMSQDIQSIVSNVDNLSSKEILKKCFSLMDLTSLHSNDTLRSVASLVEKVNSLPDDYPLPASVCVFPNFASVVRDCRKSADLHVTTVSACFPDSQSYLEVKTLESVMAVENGADEVDIVMALNAYLDGNKQAAFDEIAHIRAAIDAKAASLGRKVCLKVILETGVLKNEDMIADASFLAMEAGADFIKTSTGRVSVNATPVSAYIMCECIRKYYELTGRKVGFKAAGGISTAKEALGYYFIVSSVLGKDWLTKDLFRLGVSRLGNSLMSAIEERTVTYF